jgi:hypothetical protein
MTLDDEMMENIFGEFLKSEKYQDSLFSKFSN